MEYDADFHKERIFGAHVQEYMETMKDEDKEGYEKLYSGSHDRFLPVTCSEAWPVASVNCRSL